MKKYLLLEAKRENWGLISEGDWASMSWKIYSDRSYNLQIGFVPEKKPSDYTYKRGTMRIDSFDKLCVAMDQDWSSDIMCIADGGEVWELKQYSPDGIIIRSSGELGYIYGQEALERIVRCLPGKTFVKDNTRKAEGMFYQQDKGDRVWWYDTNQTGLHLFSFDKKKVYNLFLDYPWKLSVTEWLTFKKENEFWYDFFKIDNSEYEKEHRKEIEERLIEEAHREEIEERHMEEAH